MWLSAQTIAQLSYCIIFNVTKFNSRNSRSIDFALQSLGNNCVICSICSITTNHFTGLTSKLPIQNDHEETKPSYECPFKYYSILHIIDPHTSVNQNIRQPITTDKIQQIIQV
ncbi:hypothetical protein ACTA71_002500 [Dictyostelium dimigraforme]